MNTRFLMRMRKQQTMPTPRQEASKAGGVATFQVFLDASGSMGWDLNGSTKIQKGKDVLRSLFPRFASTPTRVHKIGEPDGRKLSRRIFKDIDDLEDHEDDLIAAWSHDAACTFLWEYIYQEASLLPQDNIQEIIIITDGIDNASSGEFQGLEGFQALTSSMSKNCRISLLLLGKARKDVTNKYRDLCMATGGFFHNYAEHSECTEIVVKFVAPLMLPEGTRSLLAMEQKGRYFNMLDNGEAIKIAGFLPLTNGGTGIASGSPAPRNRQRETGSTPTRHREDPPCDCCLQ